MNGPNLNRRGTRKPELYGTTTLPQVEARCRESARQAGADLVAFQSNHEGALIDFLQQHRDAAGAIINPGGLAHTDRKSTRLNSSHANISYAVFCLKKKKIKKMSSMTTIISAQ